MKRDLNYPDIMFRGISNQKFIVDNIVQLDAFALDPVRKDGYCEISITWCDDEFALNTLLMQTKIDNEIQFKAGAAEISFISLKLLMKPFLNNESLKYERKPSLANKYHGNLLINDTISRKLKQQIRSSLATLASGTIHENPFMK